MYEVGEALAMFGTADFGERTNSSRAITNKVRRTCAGQRREGVGVKGAGARCVLLFCRWCRAQRFGDA